MESNNMLHYSNATSREKNRRYMVMKGGLAWLLCRQKRTLEGEVVDHWFNRGLGVYRKEVTDGEHNK